MRTLLNRFLLGTFIGVLLWMLMTGILQWQELLTGIATTGVVTYLSLSRLHILDDLLLKLTLPWSLLHYLLVFLRALIRSNIDMARRVISPGLPIYISGGIGNSQHCLCRQPLSLQ